MNLRVVLPFHSGDIDLALSLLGWIAELGGCPDVECLLLQDANVDKGKSDKMIAAAAKAFGPLAISQAPETLRDEPWPTGTNRMFETALKDLKNAPGKPWLWLEPDCVPLSPDWFEKIEADYMACGKPYYGSFVKSSPGGLEGIFFSGVAVYPANAWRIFLPLVEADKTKAFDVQGSPQVLPIAYNSPLFHHFYGERNLPPTFVANGKRPENYLDPASFPKEAVLFHRCKDKSLFEVLRPRLLKDGKPLKPRAKVSMADAEEEPPPPEKEPILTILLRARDEKPPKQLKFFHCVERHPQRTPEDESRVLRAFNSWVALYKTGRVVPCHLWDYPRSSKGLGDARGLAYLRDVLIPGMTKAGPDDIVFVTNDDTIIHPKTIEAAEQMLVKAPAICSPRANYYRHEMPSLAKAPVIRYDETDIGRDFFAFRKSWLQAHWSEIPDFLLGELEWDLVLMTLVRKAAGIFTTTQNRTRAENCELAAGFILHEHHERSWNKKEFENSPAKQHNRRLAVKWYSDNSMHALIPEWK